MTDRLDDIKDGLPKGAYSEHAPAEHDIKWLVAEVERLRALVGRGVGLLHHTWFWTPDGQQHPHPDCESCQWQEAAQIALEGSHDNR